MLYFDHAATSWPKPREVPQAMLSAMTRAGGNPGRSAHPLSVRAAETVFHARETAASFFHAPEPENVLFYPNATYALNAVFHGLDTLRAGAHVLISEMEHNAVLRPLHALEEEKGICFETYPVFRDRDSVLSDSEILAGIQTRLRAETVLVCACHVSNVCGAALPIAKIGELCRLRGIPFLADASQSAGVWDIDMERDSVDYLCTAGHKALLGPQGSGLLLLGKNAAVPRSFVQGGNGVASLSPAMPDELPEALEAGTLSTLCIAGLDAGMQVLRRVGLETVRGECFRIYRRLREMLLNTPKVTVFGSAVAEGTTLSVAVEGKTCTALAEALGDAGICTRSGFHCAPLPHRAFGTEKTGTLRISVGFGNTMRETEQFYTVLKRLL